ncbi:hypothetical protein L596_017898 [Steinernema carpocapsae]|uniref:Uncharacterized protein n=1 Tax=Steinernema carpocapsae TaxID=34508 RepID=A0A4U5N3C1_STECR|nr:hypothetical protein L596_017898 [Steinernema carpocapsae]
MDRTPPRPHLLSDSEGSSESARRFRGIGLRIPGNWEKDPNLMDLFRRSESCHLWFEKTEKPNGIKSGGFSVVWPTVEDAYCNFEKVRKMVVDGTQLHVQASKAFYDAVERIAGRPPLLFNAHPSGDKANRTLYAVKLVHSLERQFLTALFEAEHLETVQMVSRTLPTGAYAQAEIVFKSAEQARIAMEDVDKTPIDDGEEQLEIRLLWPAEYVEYDATPDLKPHPNANGNISPIKNGSPRKQSVSVSHPPVSPEAPTHHPPTPTEPKPEDQESEGRTGSEELETERASSGSGSVGQESTEAALEELEVPTEAVPAPEVTQEDVFDHFEEHIANHRINWAEIEGVAGLWDLCDKVSSIFGGLPNSLLKGALLVVLEQHYDAATTPWMKNHLDVLIKAWKKVVVAEKTVLREGMFAASAPNYVPFHPVNRKRKQNAELKRAKMMAGSLGQLLNHARIQFAKEDGELDVDEDEHGNFKIDGHQLSFENWGKMCHKQESATKKEAPVNRFTQAKYEAKLAKQDKRIKAQMARAEKIKKMRAGLVIEGEEEMDTASVDDTADTVSEPSSDKMNSRTKRKKIREELQKEKEQKVKEDGEMSSDSEKRGGTAASSSDSSSSSESSSDEDENPRRRKKRPQTPSASQEPHERVEFCMQGVHRKTLRQQVQPRSEPDRRAEDALLGPIEGNDAPNHSGPESADPESVEGAFGEANGVRSLKTMYILQYPYTGCDRFFHATELITHPVYPTGCFLNSFEFHA